MQSELVHAFFGGPRLILFGIAVLVARHLAWDAEKQRQTDALHVILGVIGWVLIATGTLSTCGSLFLVIGVGGLVVWIFVLVVLVEVLVKRQVTQRRAFLWVLTVAAERFIPLSPAIRAFAWERGGLFSQRARRLARMLEAGARLPEALAGVRGLLPRDAMPSVSVGYESGALAAGLRQAAARRDVEGPLWHALSGKLIYICAFPLFALCVLGFVMLRVIPSYASIFADFEARLPALTVGVIEVSSWLVRYWILFAPLFFAALLLLLWATARYVGWTGWELPGLGRLTLRFDTAVILDSLALAAEARRPLPAAIVCLAGCYPSRSIRRRLSKVSADLASGGDWCESLLARGLIRRADRGVLQAAQRAGNLPWALREMADSNRRRLAYRLHALLQLLFPPVVVAFGLLVLFFVVALFLPLVVLIQRCT